MLTPKQERFAIALVAGASQREAYKGAYDASRMKDSTIDRKACELFANGKVRARCAELTRAIAEHVAWERVRAAHELLDVLLLAKGHILATSNDTAAYTARGHRQVADLPEAASRTFMAAVRELNRMFDVNEGTTGGGSVAIIIIDDIPQ